MSTGTGGSRRTVDYDGIAHLYDERYRRNQYVGVERAVRAFLDGGARRVLEVGCGTGHWLTVVRGLGIATTGLDPSRAMLIRAAASGATPVVRGRAELLPWADGSFDRVLCINAFHHFGDKLAAVREARRVLRDGGGLIVVGLDPHTGLDRWWVYDYFQSTYATDTERYPATSAIRAMMGEAGFRRCATSVAQHFDGGWNARVAIAEGRLAKSVTSQLTALTDAEYGEGLARITDAALAAESRGEALTLVGDLRLWATTGWVGD